ncbi:MAG: nuclear transport factor 2 family protein [Pusillimonas sp.]
MTVAPTSPALAPAARLAAFYEGLTPATLDQISQYYAADARFKDPFNDVTGVIAIRAIFQHMFDTLENPRFVVHGFTGDAAQSFLTWTLYFHTRSGKQVRGWEIHGATHVQWDAGGRVAVHRDYWDVAEELYEKIPVLGGLMRILKRRMATPVPS